MSKGKLDRSGSKGKTTKMAAAYRKRRAKAHAKVAAKEAAEERRVEGLKVVNEHAAGIDIGSRSHWVCVGVSADKDAGMILEFSAYTEGLQEIVAYLRQHGVTTVAMESTGVYWIPLYELLEASGFEVLLVDPSYTKQVKGRPKTDRLDCQWIYRLHSVGLLAAAFRPDEKTCALRAYLRQRAQRHHGQDGSGHHPRHRAWRARPGETGEIPQLPGQGDGGAGRGGTHRLLSRRALVRLEAGVRGMAVLSEAVGAARGADSTAVGTDEVGPRPAASEAAAAHVRPEAERAELRCACGLVLCGGRGSDGDRRAGCANRADHNQRDRHGPVAVRDGASLL